MKTATTPQQRLKSQPDSPHGVRLEPLGDRVVVRRLEAEDRTSGGIVLPAAAREKNSGGVLQGRVVAVGEGRSLPSGGRAPLQVHEGDRVVFSAYSGSGISIEGEEWLILSEGEILAVLE